MLSIAADSQADPKASRILRSLYPQAPRRDHIIGRTVLDGQAMHTVDLAADKRFPANRNPHLKLARFSAALVVPLVRDGTVVGAIATGRLEAKALNEFHRSPPGWACDTCADAGESALPVTTSVVWPI